MNASPFRTLIAFVRCRRGSVAILFALTFTPLFMLAGGAVDYWKAIKIKASYQQAASEAALAGTKQALALEGMGDPNWRDGAITYAREFFNNNIKRDVGADVTIDVTNNDGAFLTTVKFDGQIPADLLKMFRLDSFHFSGVATSGITRSDGYVDIHIVVDNSVSMGVGATDADLKINQATIGCAVACHYDDDFAPDKVRAAGATLRIDVLKNAMVAALTKLKPDLTPDHVRIAIYTMSTRLKKVFPLPSVPPLSTDPLLSTNIDEAINQIKALEVTNELNNGGTNSTMSLRDLADQLPIGGDGFTKDSPKSSVIVMTDGVQGDAIVTSYAYKDHRGKHGHGAAKDSTFVRFDPVGDEPWPVEGFDPAVCGPIKEKNYQVFTLNVKYVIPEVLEDYRFGFIRDTLMSHISDTMQNCASGMQSAFTADQPVDFYTSVESMFKSALTFTRLKLTRDWSRRPPPATPTTGSK